MDDNNVFFKNLLKKQQDKKQIALYLDGTLVERIDMAIKLFSSISDCKSFSRNTLIEEAICKFMDEADRFLQEEHGISIDASLEEDRSERYDTVVFSSRGRGFEETFMGEGEPSCWYPCRVSESREKNLRYIAIYRGSPVSAITHYAKIKEFRYDQEKGYKVCYFEGDPIQLPNEVKLGDKMSVFFLGTKYTSLESLLNATRADEVVFG